MREVVTAYLVRYCINSGLISKVQIFKPEDPSLKVVVEGPLDGNLPAQPVVLGIDVFLTEEEALEAGRKMIIDAWDEARKHARRLASNHLNLRVSE